MTCEECKRPMHYCFHIPNQHWHEAVGKKEGHLCAHCVLERLRGRHWDITWNERSELMMDGPEGDPERWRKDWRSP